MTKKTWLTVALVVLAIGAIGYSMMPTSSNNETTLKGAFDARLFNNPGADATAAVNRVAQNRAGAVRNEVLRDSYLADLRRAAQAISNIADRYVAGNIVIDVQCGTSNLTAANKNEFHSNSQNIRDASRWLAINLNSNPTLSYFTQNASEIGNKISTIGLNMTMANAFIEMQPNECITPNVKTYVFPQLYDHQNPYFMSDYRALLGAYNRLMAR